MWDNYFESYFKKALIIFCIESISEKGKKLSFDLFEYNLTSWKSIGRQPYQSDLRKPLLITFTSYKYNYTEV